MFWHIQILFRSLLMSFRALYQAIPNMTVFTYFQIEPRCFVCVYIRFNFIYYQSYAAVFAESVFFIITHLALLVLCTSKYFGYLLELLPCHCLNYVLAHSDTFPQFADVIQGIVPSNPKYDSIHILSGWATIFCMCFH